MCMWDRKMLTLSGTRNAPSLVSGNIAKSVPHAEGLNKSQTPGNMQETNAIYDNCYYYLFVRLDQHRGGGGGQHTNGKFIS